ncbi:MAG: Lrp/AsnC family transcriptional regulator [Candidatus Diapherotrites archaeon]|nr:Lrp/AsnC family transcriptional regulator [Candidatus Diapherotrites archaeon]
MVLRRVELDRIDRIILEALLSDGRASFSAIARQAKLTDVAIKKRVEMLKKRGIVSSITANLNFKALGFENPIYVQMRSEISKNRDVIKKLLAMDSIVELYQVLGEYNLLAKIVVSDLESAESLINKVGLVDGIIDVKTLVVMSEISKTAILPSQSLQKKL